MPKLPPITPAMRRNCFKYNERLRRWRDTDMQIEGISEAEFIRRNQREIDEAIREGHCEPPPKPPKGALGTLRLCLPIKPPLARSSAAGGPHNG